MLGFPFSTSGYQYSCIGGHCKYILAGNGPDGNGAIFNAVTGNRQMDAFFSDVELTADATIGFGSTFISDSSSYSQTEADGTTVRNEYNSAQTSTADRWHGFGGRVDLHGYTLTLTSDTTNGTRQTAYFGAGYQFNGTTSPYKTTITPGDIVLHNVVSCFEYEPVFTSLDQWTGRAITVEMVANADRKVRFRDIAEGYRVFPMGIAFEGDGYLQYDAKAGMTNCNFTINGPLSVGGNVIIAMEDGADRTLTLNGPVTGTGHLQQTSTYAAKLTTVFNAMSSSPLAKFSATAGTVKAVVGGALPVTNSISSSVHCDKLVLASTHVLSSFQLNDGVLEIADGANVTVPSNDGKFLGGQWNQTGGTITFEHNTHVGQEDSQTTGSLVMSLYGDGYPVLNTDDFLFYKHGADFVSMLNLDAGVMTATAIIVSGLRAPNCGHTYLNFNGGTLKHVNTDSKSAFFRSGAYTPNAVTVFGGGATIYVPEGKTNAFCVTYDSCGAESVVFQSAPGKCITAVNLPGDMPLTGYSGAEQLAVSGGDGTAFSAALDVTNGVLRGVVVTCPGWNYANAPTVTVKDPGGIAHTCEVVLSDGDQTLGAFTKTGGGQLEVNVKTNLFKGEYVVREGTLRFPSAASVDPECSIRLAGGVLNGSVSRTVLSLGGFGSVRLNKDNGSAERLYVSGEFAFDSADLLAGRYVSMESETAETEAQDKGDRIVISDGVKLRVANPDPLIERGGVCQLLSSPSAPIEGPVPEVVKTDPKMARWRCELSADRKTLNLRCFSIRGLVILFH